MLLRRRYARSVISIRAVDPAAEAAAVSRLVGNYLRQTESEKADRGLATFLDGGRLPSHYEREIESPAETFDGCAVFLAFDDGDPAGMVVVKPVAGGAEIKRLWVEPAHRGKSVASLLIHHLASSMEFDVLRLSVWQWRKPALALYEKLGFVRVASWENRPQLICLERPR